MKIYSGTAADQQVVVLVADEEAVPLQRVRTVDMKRPDGLHAWGYQGGGPRDLAFELLLDVTGDRGLAQTHLDDFCAEQIAGIPQERDFEITDEAIKAWLRPRGVDV